MRRRDFITLLGCVPASRPFLASAHGPANIGLLEQRVRFVRAAAVTTLIHCARERGISRFSGFASRHKSYVPERPHKRSFQFSVHTAKDLVSILAGYWRAVWP